MRFTFNTDFKVHPVGVHPGVLTDVNEIDTRFGPRLKWLFETGEKDSNGNPIVLSILTGANFHPEAMITRLVRALGIEPPTDASEAEAFNPFAFIGRQVRLVVRHKSNGRFLTAEVFDVLPV
jgi:hypothetical protein